MCFIIYRPRFSATNQDPKKTLFFILLCPLYIHPFEATFAIPLRSPSNLSEQDAVEQELRLHLVLGDVSVGVHAEDLRRGVRRERSGVLYEAIMLRTGRKKKRDTS